MALTITLHDQFDSKGQISNDLDQGMLEFALSKVARFTHNASHIDIYPNFRDSKGWLEWGVSITFEPNGKLFLGCIQREPRADFESHS